MECWIDVDMRTNDELRLSGHLARATDWTEQRKVKSKLPKHSTDTQSHVLSFLSCPTNRI